MKKNKKTKNEGKEVDWLVYITLLFSLLLIIPEIIGVWYGEPKSLFHWSLLFLISLGWFFYGLIQKYYPIIISFGVWMLAEIIIILGIFFQ